MAIKNYLVFQLYKVDGEHYAKTHMYEEYRKALDFTIPSFQENLVGLDEVIVLDGKSDNIKDVFRQGVYRIYDLWKSEGPCNIVYAGVDTYCLNKVDLFNQFDKFMMFNYCDPGVRLPKYPHYFNCDVRYYPHDLPEEVWRVGLDLADNFDYAEWNCIQEIYNEMLWSQPDIKPEDVYKPNIAYQYFLDGASGAGADNGGVNIEDAKIIHFAGTRNIDHMIDMVNQIKEGVS